MKKAIGSITLDDKSTYDVRVCILNQIGDNQSYASSQTAGKTYSVPGNITVTREISLYAKGTESEMPAALGPGRIISLQLKNDTQLHKLLIDLSDLEVDLESDKIFGISLSCSDTG